MTDAQVARDNQLTELLALMPDYLASKGYQGTHVENICVGIETTEHRFRKSTRRLMQEDRRVRPLTVRHPGNGIFKAHDMYDAVLITIDGELVLGGAFAVFSINQELRDQGLIRRGQSGPKWFCAEPFATKPYPFTKSIIDALQKELGL